MRMFPLAIAVLAIVTGAPAATTLAQSPDEPIVLMTLDDVEREKAEAAERDAEIARRKAECAAQGKRYCLGVPFSLQPDRAKGDSDAPAISFNRAPPVNSGPSRAAQVDQDADVACKLEQARRDRDYVSGEGPICRKKRLARESAEDSSQYRVARPVSEPAAAKRESNCRKLADGSTQCGWSKTTTRKCETQADGTETCTTSTSSGVTFGRDD